MPQRLALPILVFALAGSAASPADAAVYCRAVGVPKGCIAAPVPTVVVTRPAAVVTPAPVVVGPGPVVAPRSAVNRGGPVNRVGVR